MSPTHLAPPNEIILFETADGKTQVDVRLKDHMAWLSQAQMADLYQTSPQNISMHLKAIFQEGELTEEATCKDFLQVRTEGNRSINRSIRHYGLDAVIAVGYRVTSPRATQFRQWATSTLREYLVKGFVMNDAKLKNPEWDYFDELLERIRDIRASEKRFYQKIRDLFALSQDYRDDPQVSQSFFAEVQNKMLYAVTGHTAAELVIKRADPEQPNMNLKSWTGQKVRKADVVVAKNYLSEAEIIELNRIVSMYLDYAEDRVSRRQQLTLNDWRQYMNNFIVFNERPLLQGPGRMSHEQMARIVHARYADFDHKRKGQEALDADKTDIQALEVLERQFVRKEED
ncbi:virulence RhuM family protein [Desulfolutivibrio sp.]|uniref:virulence RhuM family protein n=1 Tax=Desulfolutivibrio sp. TaxID=2773296 RepID=UPI002F96E522